MGPYYEDDSVQLYLGDMREILPALGLQADCIVTDPPYNQTKMKWDIWPDGWPTLAATIANNMWCFGSLRMFLTQRDEFAEAGWRLSQDIVWRKNAGSSFVADRFKRIHESAAHWYLGNWADVYRDPLRVLHHGRREGTIRKRARPEEHVGEVGASTWSDDGTRLASSVIDASNLRGLAVHPTQKPLGILDPLIRYACPPGGLVVDPFAGSGSTLDAARQTGRRAIGIEAHEPYAEAAARRLSALTLPAA